MVVQCVEEGLLLGVVDPELRKERTSITFLMTKNMVYIQQIKELLKAAVKERLFLIATSAPQLVIA